MTTPNETPAANAPSEDEAIKKFIAELHSHESHRRWDAAKTIAQLKVSNQELIKVLEAVAAGDPKNFVREAAHEALVALGHASPSLMAPDAFGPQPPFYLQPDFWLGFVGWWAVNGLWWGMVSSMPSGGGFSLESLLCVIAPLPLNFIVLVVAAFKRRYVAGGILVAVAVNIAISVALGILTNPACAVYPFFVVY